MVGKQPPDLLRRPHGLHDPLVLVVRVSALHNNRINPPVHDEPPPDLRGGDEGHDGHVRLVLGELFDSAALAADGDDEVTVRLFGHIDGGMADALEAERGDERSFMKLASVLVNIKVTWHLNIYGTSPTKKSESTSREGTIITAKRSEVMSREA